MLAGERQLRTGIALSFAAALAQSLTAIIFIVVAAAILRMSSVAMNGVAGSIETLSYALIVLLGIWLLVRRFFGHGHDHGHDHDTTIGTITNMRMKATPIIMSSCPKRVRTCARRSAWCWRSVSGPVPVP